MQPKSVADSVACNVLLGWHWARKESEITHTSSVLNAELLLAASSPGRHDWYVRFVPPSADGIRRGIFRSTGPKEIPAAKRIAAQIIESFWTEPGRSAERFKLHNDHTIIGELIERCRASAAQGRTNS